MALLLNIKTSNNKIESTNGAFSNILAFFHTILLICFCIIFPIDIRSITQFMAKIRTDNKINKSDNTILVNNSNTEEIVKLIRFTIDKLYAILIHLSFLSLLI
jgi:hypothetical protein